MFSFSPWKLSPNCARIEEGTNPPCAVMDLTLKSAADFMEDHKHFLEGWRGTFTQILAELLLGIVYRKKVSIAFRICVSLN